MNFTKIKVTLIGTNNKVYRHFYVDEKINLDKFGAAVLSTFDVSFERYYLFHCNGVNFEPKVFLEDDWEIPGTKRLALMDYCFKDVPLDVKKSFELTYDTGEDYNFRIEVLEKDVNYEPLEEYEDELIHLIDGEGLGIFENNHWLLINFLRGRSLKTLLKSIAKDCDCDEEDYEDFAPYNIDMTDGFTLKNYFEPLDIEALNDNMYFSMIQTREEFYEDI